MTQKEKNNLDKKNKVKKIVFKVLHVIGYICTLFTILLCIGLGVSSCDNQNRNDHTQSQNEKVTKDNNFYYDNGTILNFTLQDLSNAGFIRSLFTEFSSIGITSTKYSITPSTSFQASCSGNYQTGTFNIGGLAVTGSLADGQFTIRFYNSTSSNYFCLTYTFGSYQYLIKPTYVNSGTTYFINVCSITLNYSQSSSLSSSIINCFLNSLDYVYEGVVYEPSGGYTSEDLVNSYWGGYDDGYSIGYNFGFDDGYDEGLENFIAPVIDTEISINYNYDFRKWYATEIDYNSGILLIDSLNSLATYNSAEVFQFYVGGGEWYIGGKKYNGVVSSVISLTEDNYLRCADNSHNYVSHFIRNSNLKTFGYLYTHYVYFDETPEYTGWKSTLSYNYLANSDYSLKVQECFTTGFTGAEEGSLIPTTFIKICDVNWTDSGFRFLKFYSSENNYVSVPNYSNNLTLMQLLSLNDESIVTSNTAYANVMTMLSSAFNGLANLLIIPILPGITLGILLFLPLVVGVIVIIIKMLRK